MRRMVAMIVMMCVAGMFVLAGGSAWAQDGEPQAAKSPWGPEDEIGTLNMMTDTSRLDIIRQVMSGKVYDLGVELYSGMPSCCAAFGDPQYHLWMTHTPRGTVAANPFGVSREVNERVSYSGDAVTMYTHSGTHLDTLNHFGLHGKIWNQFAADDHLGDQGWSKGGADKYPPIVARGVLVDLAKSMGVQHLTASYAITPADLQTALREQGTQLQPGDVVLIRTGLMTLWPDPSKYTLGNQPGPVPGCRQMASGRQPGHAPRRRQFRYREFFRPRTRPTTCRCTPICSQSAAYRSSKSCGWKTWRRTKCTNSCLSPRPSNCEAPPDPHCGLWQFPPSGRRF